MKNMAEKWNREAFLDSYSKKGLKENTKEEIDNAAFFYLKDSETINDLNKKELEKTDEDRRLITDIQSALDAALKDFGVGNLKLRPESIHFLDVEDYIKKIDIRNPARFYPPSEIYTVREKLGASFNLGDKKYQEDLSKYIVYFLLHEISHFISSSRAKITGNEDGGHDLRERRMGFSHLITKKEDGGQESSRWEHEGFNEAATEIFTEKLGRQFNKINKNKNIAYLPEKSRAISASYGQRLILQEMIKRVSEFNKNDYANVEYEMLHDYITGSANFIKELKRVNKEYAKELLAMDNKNENAFEVAKRLGFDVVAQKIDSYIIGSSIFK